MRSPTAEQIFALRDDIEVDSAGTNVAAENPLTAELIAWADMIVVMEKMHRAKIQRRYRGILGHRRIICLDIPDNYRYMQPELITLLQTRMVRHLSMTRHSLVQEGRMPAGFAPGRIIIP